MTDKQLDNRLLISMSEPYQRMKADYTRHLLMWSLLREYADHQTLKYSIKDMQYELNRDVDKKKNKQQKSQQLKIRRDSK